MSSSLIQKYQIYRSDALLSFFLFNNVAILNLFLSFFLKNTNKIIFNLHCEKKFNVQSRTREQHEHNKNFVSTTGVET